MLLSCAMQALRRATARATPVTLQRELLALITIVVAVATTLYLAVGTAVFAQHVHVSY
jgi:hypothetical protein